MPSTFFLAPTPKMYFFDAEGRPAANGTMHTFQSDNPIVPKPVFMDPGGTFPWPNPITLDGTGGTPGLIYWENNQGDPNPNRYQLVIKDASGRQILSADNYPIVAAGTGPPVTVTTDVENFLINGNFHFISNEIFGGIVSDIIKTPVPSPVPEGIIRVAPGAGSIDTIRGLQGNYTSGSVVNNSGTAIDARVISGWTFEKTGGATLTDTLDFINTTAGTAIPAGPSQNAPRYFQYNAIITGATTVLDLVYTIPDVRTFAGKTISVTFDANASGPSGATDFIIEQNFGTGGTPAPTVTTPFSFSFPNGVWDRVPLLSKAVPPITGNIGSNRDSFVKLRWRFPINTVAAFNITNLQLQVGTPSLTDFIYQTFNQTAHSVLAELISAHLPKTGDWKASESPDAATGWIVVDSDTQSIGKTTGGFVGEEVRNLYKLWWIYDNTVHPMSGGTRGTSADADFDAGKLLLVGPKIGRVLGWAGQGVGLTLRTPGNATGDEVVNLTGDQNGPHTHTYNTKGLLSLSDDGIDSWKGDMTEDTGSSGTGADHENMQPSIFFHAHIKL